MKKASRTKTVTGGREAMRAPRGSAEPPDFLTDTIEAKGTAAAVAPATERRSLGERIREVRETRGLTIEDLSSRTGISVDALERIEANETTPPLSQLVRLGKALDMKMGYFLSAGEPRPMCVVRAHARRTVARRGKRASEQYGYVYESLAAEKTDRCMEPFLVTMVPSEFGELSSHDGQEFLFVLEGEIRVQVGHEVQVLHAGDSVYYDSPTPHLVKCHGKRPAKIIAVLYTGEK